MPFITGVGLEHVVRDEPLVIRRSARGTMGTQSMASLALRQENEDEDLEAIEDRQEPPVYQSLLSMKTANTDDLWEMIRKNRRRMDKETRMLDGLMEDVSNLKSLFDKDQRSGSKSTTCSTISLSSSTSTLALRNGGGKANLRGSNTSAGYSLKGGDCYDLLLQSTSAGKNGNTCKNGNPGIANPGGFLNRNTSSRSLVLRSQSMTAIPPSKICSTITPTTGTPLNSRPEFQPKAGKQARAPPDRRTMCISRRAQTPLLVRRAKSATCL